MSGQRDTTGKCGQRDTAGKTAGDAARAVRFFAIKAATFILLPLAAAAVTVAIMLK